MLRSPLIRTGQTDMVQELVDKNNEVFRDYDTVLTICAGCGSTLKNEPSKIWIQSKCNGHQ